MLKILKSKYYQCPAYDYCVNTGVECKRSYAHARTRARATAVGYGLNTFCGRVLALASLVPSARVSRERWRVVGQKH